MRPRVRGLELVVIAEAFTQISSQPVINRAAIGIVGIHVAERNATSQTRKVARSRIASRIETGRAVSDSMKILHNQRQYGAHAGSASIGDQGISDRRIVATRTEEVGQRSRNPWQTVVGIDAARSCTEPNAQRSAAGCIGVRITVSGL